MRASGVQVLPLSEPLDSDIPLTEKGSRVCAVGGQAAEEILVAAYLTYVAMAIVNPSPKTKRAQEIFSILSLSQNGLCVLRTVVGESAAVSA